MSSWKSKLRPLLEPITPPVVMNMIRRRPAVGELEVWAAQFGRQSYSQDGEDLLLKSFLGDLQVPGFYADVGAYHPAKYSNTLLFYLNGWRGINLDARPGSMKLFNQWRPADINLEMGISEAKGQAVYHMFDEPALNCFSEELAKARDRQGEFHIIDKKTVVTEPLRAIFAAHVPAGVAIDFLSVDVEGMELAVLKSNDWERWRPSLVLTEDLNLTSISGADDTEIGGFMKSTGYVPCARTRFSLCFAEKSRVKSTVLGLQVQRAAPAGK